MATYNMALSVREADALHKLVSVGQLALVKHEGKEKPRDPQEMTELVKALKLAAPLDRPLQEPAAWVRSQRPN